MQSRSAAIISSVIVTAGGFAAMLVHYVAGSPTPGDPEGWFAAIGFGAPFVGAGIVAGVGAGRDQPVLALAAGIALILMSVVSVVLLPLVLPAAVLVAFGTTVRQVSPVTATGTGLAGLGLIGTFGILVFHQDPATWTSPEGPAGSSNIVTATEASLAIAAAVFAVVVALALSLTTATSDERR